MWHNIEEKIVAVKGFCLSSKYGDGKIYGQQLEVKTLGFIEIISESGEKGFGESYAAIYTPELLPHIVKFFERQLVGKIIGRINLVEEVTEIPFVGRNGLLKSISGAIEIALWDLRGKLLNKPTYQLFPSKRKMTKCYASGGSVIMNNKEILQDVEKSIKEGFNAYKMRVGYQIWKKDLERVKSAKVNLEKGDLMVDAIMGTLKNPWGLNEAIKKIKSLSKYNLRWIEEPLHPNNIHELSLLRKKSPIPVAAGEAYSGLLEYETILRNKSVNILQFDCTHSGGIELCRKLSKKCKENNIECAIHVWGSALALAANTHLSYSLDNIIYLEIPRIKLEISDYLWLSPPSILNGSIKLSDAPGLGINITDEIKNKFPFIKGSGFKIKK